MSAPLPKLEQYTFKDQCPSCESILHVKSYVSYSAPSVHALLEEFERRIQFIHDNTDELTTSLLTDMLLEDLREVRK